MSKKVAIILGNRVNDDGTITKIQEQRLEMALEIEKEFQPDYFILSGGSPNKKAGISEALGMYKYLIEKGFNKDKLILEDQSYSTKQNAEFSIPIAEKLGADIVIVCSSLYHFEDLQYHALEHFINEVKKTKMALLIYTK